MSNSWGRATPRQQQKWQKPGDDFFECSVMVASSRKQDSISKLSLPQVAQQTETLWEAHYKQTLTGTDFMLKPDRQNTSRVHKRNLESDVHSIQ